LKILWCGDSPTVETGFGVVSKNILKGLQAKGHQISVLGINEYGNPYDHREFPYDIWPCDKGGPEQIYGYKKLWWVAAKVQPDLIFFLNDPWIIDMYLQNKPKDFPATTKIMAYFPTDAEPLKPEWANMLSRLDAQVCYSKYAERVIVEANGKKIPKNLHQIYHGVDRSIFKPINQSRARAELGLSQDSFIVGMVARNQYRKRFDIMMRAFSRFAKDKPNAKLYLHTALQDIGWDIPDMSRQFGLGDQLILTEEMQTLQNTIPATALNLIYNSFDVNCLLSLGDGFGLPVAESMSTGCPQLVSDHSCLKELVENHGGLTIKTAAWIMNTGGIQTWGGVPDVDDTVAKLNKLYENETLRVSLAEQGYAYISQPQFTWEYAVDKFDRIIKDIFHIL
jgi:glycosyltransferase involved in cell wall biosynthesis